MSGRRVPRPSRSARRAASVLVFAAVALLHPSRSWAQSAADGALKAKVEAVLGSMSDVPSDSITVQASAGVVTLSGTLVCDRCGAGATPGGTATLEQNVAAVVRAVPGVEKVEIRLKYEP
jgi:osmotically-inducible protein OsmY